MFWRVIRLLRLPTVLAIVLTGCTAPEPSSGIGTAASPTVSVSAGSRKININTALLSELDGFEGQLGIPALSNRIQAARPYARPEELVSKQVLTQPQFDRIKDQLTVEESVLTGRARDIEYLTKLGLMRGHLLVARELLARGEAELALPHFGHPVEEIYLDIENQLQERRVPEFKSVLLKLENLVRFTPQSPEIAPALAATFAAIDTAAQSIPDRDRSVGVVLQVINGLLDNAAAEYSAAVSGEKITARIEYEDSRGFVLHARELYAQIAPELVKKSPADARIMTTDLDKLATAWPAIQAPSAPVVSSDEVIASVRFFEAATQKFIPA